MKSLKKAPRALNEEFQADAELEGLGIFRHELALELRCVRERSQRCCADLCMAWRKTDEAHGYCALIAAVR